MANKEKIIRIRRIPSLNIGIIVFLIIIIYMGFNLISYLTSSPVAEYEVGQGTIATNHVYRGLIIRDETIVYAGQSGYINYYIKNGQKVSVNDIVYSIDTQGELSKKISTAAKDGTTLTAQALSEIADKIDLFRNSYDSNLYSSVYTLKEELDSQLTKTLSVNALNELSDAIDSAEANNTFYKKKSEKPGIIVYYTDGYENITTDNFSSDHLISTNYKKVSLENNTQVSAQDAAYKRINSEKWNVILPISDTVAKQISENEYIKIRFCKDDFTITVPFSLMKKDGSYYITLTLRTAMIRYVNDRFVDVELILSEKTGLKIPNSSITSKEFYTVPKKYFTQGGNSSAPGLLIQNNNSKKNAVTLVQPTIYYESKKAYYIDDEYVNAGDIVVQNDSSSKYTIGDDIGTLTGVYNINKGYAVFKQINILSQNDNYAIVDPKTDYGIALYDHIALDGSKVKENQLVIQ